MSAGQLALLKPAINKSVPCVVRVLRVLKLRVASIKVKVVGGLIRISAMHTRGEIEEIACMQSQL